MYRHHTYIHYTCKEKSKKSAATAARTQRGREEGRKKEGGREGRREGRTQERRDWLPIGRRDCKFETKIKSQLLCNTTYIHKYIHATAEVERDKADCPVPPPPPPPRQVGSEDW